MGAWFWPPYAYCSLLVLLSSYSSQSSSDALLLKLSAPSIAPPASSSLLASSDRAAPLVVGVRKYPPSWSLWSLRSLWSLHLAGISAAAVLCARAQPRSASLSSTLGSGGNDPSFVDGSGNGASHGALASLNVVVTGANRGLGFAIAERMARLGHRVVLACRSEREVSTAVARGDIHSTADNTNIVIIRTKYGINNMISLNNIQVFCRLRAPAQEATPRCMTDERMRKR